MCFFSAIEHCQRQGEMAEDQRLHENSNNDQRERQLHRSDNKIVSSATVADTSSWNIVAMC